MQECPLSPALFLFVMQAYLVSLDRAMPAEAGLRLRTNTRTSTNGGKVAGTDWPDKGEFEFSFWASLYADAAATALDSRGALLAATSALDAHLKKSGLLMRVGVPGGKRRKMEAIYCSTREGGLDSSDTSDLVLDCGGVVNYPGFILHRDLSDHHGVGARIKKASKAFGALRNRVFSSKDVPERPKGKVFKGGVLVELLCGCEFLCLTAEATTRLRNWQSKRIREVCRVAMTHTYVHRTTSKSL